MAKKESNKEYYHGEPFTWEFSVYESFFTKYENVADDYTTLQDISWCLKRDPQDDADDEYLQVLWTNGANANFIFNPLKHSIKVIIEPDNYVNIPNNDIEYEVVIAFQVSDYTQWIELKTDFPNNENKIKITQDKHRV